MKWFPLLMLVWVPVANAEPLVGVYPCCSHIHAAIPNIDELNAVSKPKGVSLGILGDFISFDNPNLKAVLSPSLEAAWQLGAIPFVNVMRHIEGKPIDTPAPLSQIAWPTNDAEWAISNRAYTWASLIKQWGQKGGGRHVYLALWPEVNGSWTNYHSPPKDFIEAFRKVKYVFWQVGALEYTYFVYAPNEGTNIASYYPGTHWVDAIGISAFNNGTCDQYHGFRTYDQVIVPALRSLRTLNSGKPLIVAQTGVLGFDELEKAHWLKTFTSRIRLEKDVAAFLYFNRPDVKNSCGHFGIMPESWAVEPLDWRLP